MWLRWYSSLWKCSREGQNQGQRLSLLPQHVYSVVLRDSWAWAKVFRLREVHTEVAFIRVLSSLSGSCSMLTLVAEWQILTAFFTNDYSFNLYRRRARILLKIRMEFLRKSLVLTWLRISTKRIKRFDWGRQWDNLVLNSKIPSNSCWPQVNQSNSLSSTFQMYYNEQKTLCIIWNYLKLIVICVINIIW